MVMTTSASSGSARRVLASLVLSVAAAAVHAAYPAWKPDTFYAAGTYKFNVDGRYFSQFNRANPIEGKARDQAWSPTGLALISNLGVGTATATALQLGFGIAGLFAGMGIFALIAGFGLVWVAQTLKEAVAKPSFQPKVAPTPA